MDNTSNLEVAGLQLQKTPDGTPVRTLKLQFIQAQHWLLVESMN